MQGLIIFQKFSDQKRRSDILNIPSLEAKKWPWMSQDGRKTIYRRDPKSVIAIAHIRGRIFLSRDIICQPTVRLADL